MASVKIVNSENHLAKTFKTKNFGILKFVRGKRKTKIQQVLPFRVKFINVGISGYGPGNVPPIGIAVIGVNNYIL